MYRLCRFAAIVLLLVLSGLAQPLRALPQVDSHVDVSYSDVEPAPQAPADLPDAPSPMPGDAAEGEPSRSGEAESETEVALPHEGPAPCLLNAIVHRARPLVCTPRLGEAPGVHRPPTQV